MQRVTNEYTSLLERDGFYIRRGWDSGIAEGLVLGSQEPHVMLFTPRDASDRFTTLESAEEWYSDPAKQRVVYTLGDKAIGGVIWFSKESREIIPASDASVGTSTVELARPETIHHTFAIRMYERARGKHLAGHFLEAAHRDFALLTDEEKTWLSVDEQNEAAIHLYEASGYKPVGSEEGRIIMVRDPRAIRETLDAQYSATHELDVV